MLKNRVKGMSKKIDDKKGIEVIKDLSLSSIKGGNNSLQPSTCSKLKDCGWNSEACPSLTSCSWNG